MTGVQTCALPILEERELEHQIQEWLKRNTFLSIVAVRKCKISVYKQNYKQDIESNTLWCDWIRIFSWRIKWLFNEELIWEYLMI